MRRNTRQMLIFYQAMGERYIPERILESVERRLKNGENVYYIIDDLVLGRKQKMGFSGAQNLKKRI